MVRVFDDIVFGVHAEPGVLIGSSQKTGLNVRPRESLPGTGRAVDALNHSRVAIVRNAVRHALVLENSAVSAANPALRPRLERIRSYGVSGVAHVGEFGRRRHTGIGGIRSGGKPDIAEPVDALRPAPGRARCEPERGAIFGSGLMDGWRSTRRRPIGCDATGDAQIHSHHQHPNRPRRHRTSGPKRTTPWHPICEVNFAS